MQPNIISVAFISGVVTVILLFMVCCVFWGCSSPLIMQAALELTEEVGEEVVEYEIKKYEASSEKISSPEKD